MEFCAAEYPLQTTKVLEKMRATVVSRMRATLASLAAKEKDVYRLNPMGPKPKRLLGIVYNSQARRASP